MEDDALFRDVEEVGVELGVDENEILVVDELLLDEEVAKRMDVF